MKGLDLWKGLGFLKVFTFLTLRDVFRYFFFKCFCFMFSFVV